MIYHTQPLLLVGLAAVLLGENITGSHLVRALVAFAGVALISLGAQGVGGEPVGPAGVGLARAAAVLYAGASPDRQTARAHPAASAGRDPVHRRLRTADARAAVHPAALGDRRPALTPAAGRRVHTAVMYVLMYSSIGKLPTGTVALVSYLYPVVAVVVDVLAYGHRITLVEGIGMVAVLTAAMAPRRGRRIGTQS